jgi:cytochrome c-type biogenesis protein
MADVSLIAAFFGGALAFFSPCVLPLIPGYISFVSGVSLADAEEKRGQAVLHSLLFVVGFSLVFIALGASATYIGQFLLQHLRLFYKIGGVFLIIFGLQVMEILNFRFLSGDYRVHLHKINHSPWTSILLGMAFGFGWSPCIGPLLAAILALAGSQQTIWRGMYLLAGFSLGLGIPFVATAFMLKQFMQVWKRWTPGLQIVKIIAGFLLIGSGIYFILK